MHSKCSNKLTTQTHQPKANSQRKQRHACNGRKKKKAFLQGQCYPNHIRSTSKSRTPIGALSSRTTDPNLSPPPKEILLPVPSTRHQPWTRTSPENDVKSPNSRRPRPHGRDERNASSHHRMHANLTLPAAAAAAAAAASPRATPPAEPHAAATEPIRPETRTAESKRAPTNPRTLNPGFAATDASTAPAREPNPPPRRERTSGISTRGGHGTGIPPRGAQPPPHPAGGTHQSRGSSPPRWRKTTGEEGRGSGQWRC